MNNRPFKHDSEVLMKIQQAFSEILVEVNSYHADTQNEFQFLHHQYVTVSKKILAIIQNLKKLQSVFNNKDLSTLIRNLHEMKTMTSGIHFSGTVHRGGKGIDRMILSNILELKNAIKRIKRQFRHDLITQSMDLSGEGFPVAGDPDLKNLITTDLIAMVGILENALNILAEYFGEEGNRDGSDGREEYGRIIQYIDFLLIHIIEFHGNVENNLQYISSNFEVCRQTGDEIITALQYQDIFGQKLTHVKWIIESVRDEFSQSIHNGGDANRYSYVIPEVSAILISQVKFIQDEFHKSTQTIIERLNNISRGFISSREKFWKLNYLVNPESVWIFNPVMAGKRQPAPLLNATEQEGDIESLGRGIEVVISEIKNIKGRVRDLILSALEPAQFSKSLKDQPEQEMIRGALTYYSKAMDTEREPDNRHNELIRFSNHLFDEVIVSLEDAGKRYDNMEKMSGKVSYIISRLEYLNGVEYPWKGEISEEKKSASLEDFRRTYSMQSERINHDMALGVNSGNGDDITWNDEEKDLGEVELF